MWAWREPGQEGRGFAPRALQSWGYIPGEGSQGWKSPSRDPSLQGPCWGMLPSPHLLPPPGISYFQQLEGLYREGVALVSPIGKREQAGPSYPV